MEYQTMDGDFVTAIEGLVVDKTEDGKVYVEIRKAGRNINARADVINEACDQVSVGNKVVVKIVTTKKNGVKTSEKYQIVGVLFE